jgi:hypothetical protein
LYIYIRCIYEFTYYLYFHYVRIHFFCFYQVIGGAQSDSKEDTNDGEIIHIEQNWDAFTSICGLHIGSLQFITKSGKLPRKFIDNVNPEDVQLALNMLLHLYLPKLNNSCANSQNNEYGLDNSMKLIREKAAADGIFVHSNSIGKVSIFVLLLFHEDEFIYYLISVIKSFHLIYLLIVSLNSSKYPSFNFLTTFQVNATFAKFVIDMLSCVLLFNAYTDHNSQASPTPWAGRQLSRVTELKYGNKSESQLFQENQSILIEYCRTLNMDVATKYFVKGW